MDDHTTSGSVSTQCPCGSGLVYRQCCQPLHKGASASSPEALMRSRYSAFVLGLAPYLFDSWHPSTRPATLDLSGSPEWLALHIFSARQQGDKGLVEFRAFYKTALGLGYLHELSDFVREQGRWYYLTGQVQETEM